MTHARRGPLRPCILIVEDNADLRRVLSEILQYEGFEIITVSSGEAALETLAGLEEAPQLVISDILMEGMDGCAFLTAIRANEDWRTVPVLFLSGQTQIQDICGPNGLQPDAFVEKPFTIIDLVATIKQTIERGHRPD